MNRIKTTQLLQRVFSFLLIASLVLVSVHTVALAKATVAYGDPDGDGNINATDALLVLRAAVGKIKVTNQQMTAGDVDASGELDAIDALMILQYAVDKLDKFPAEMSQEERYYADRDREYKVDGSDFEEIATFDNLEDAAAMVEKLGGDPQKKAVEGYELTSRAKLRYNPLSKEAQRKGELTKYNTAKKVTGTLKVGQSTLTYSVPTDVTAYDVIPITYQIHSKSTSTPLYVEAVTNEDVERKSGRSYFDMNLPGRVAATLSYEGHLVADAVAGKPLLNADPTKDVQGTAFPAMQNRDVVKSGTVKAGDGLWFKIKYTNTGDTIWDGDGNGAFWFNPVFQRYENGQWVHHVVSGEHQMLDAVYPGESGEFYAWFGAAAPGAYRMEITGNIMGEFGTEHTASITSNSKVVTRSVYEFTVTKEGEITPPAKMVTSVTKNYERNKWLAEYEEFMSSYISLFEVSDSGTNPTTGVFYVQPAPWSQHITLKLIDGELVTTADIPVRVKTDSIKVNLNPYNTNYIIKEDGTREPMIMTQNMVDMRGANALGPDPDHSTINYLRDMKEAGINTLTTTHAYTGDYTGFYDMSMFMLDCARVMGFKLEGHARYHYRTPAVVNLVRAFDTETNLGSGKDLMGGSQLDAANGILARWNLNRYGDFYYYNGDTKEIPIAIEDNWGWMNSLVDCRYGVGNDYSDSLLRDWLKKAYNNDIEALNRKYGSTYASFNDISLSDQGAVSINGGLHFNNYDAVYHDWNAATMELDIFRTVQRMENMQEFLNYVDVEGAKVALRSENNIFLAGGISQTTDNAHYRRIYYEQRRAAAIPEVLAASGIVYSDSSYNAWNLRPSEVYELTKQAKNTGFVTAKTPPFSRMYDDAINDLLGSIQYDDSMALGSMQRSVTMFTMGSVFQYWKAMYEGGGIPGIMWQDYVCGLYVTSTQYKEMLFFKEKMQEMLATPEGKAWAENIPQGADESPLADYATGAFSYAESYIRDQVANMPRKNYILQFDK